MDITDPAVSAYLLAHCTPPDDVLTELAAETRASAPNMQISHYEGELLTTLTRLTGARRVVGVGVFTGYSTLCIARGLPADGHLLVCEIDRRWTAIAERYWRRAGVADRIDLRIAPALRTLRALALEPVIDLGYIGADKVNYLAYYEEILTRLRPGGVIILGDTLRGGYVVDDTCRAEDVVAVRELNEFIAHDKRVDAVILAAGDGATIVLKH